MVVQDQIDGHNASDQLATGFRVYPIIDLWILFICHRASDSATQHQSEPINNATIRQPTARLPDRRRCCNPFSGIKQKNADSTSDSAPFDALSGSYNQCRHCQLFRGRLAIYNNQPNIVPFKNCINREKGRICRLSMIKKGINPIAVCDVIAVTNILINFIVARRKLLQTILDADKVQKL